MKRIVSVLLVLVLCMTLLIPFTVNGAGSEYIKLGKTSYLSGEYMEIIYNFTDADPTRWICLYKDSAVASNMVFAMSATVLSISGYFMPSVCVGVNGYQQTSLLEPGNYLIKVMYIPTDGNYSDANNFSTGAKSNLTYSFKVTANSRTTPAISVGNREIEKNGKLTVSYQGISHIIGNRALNLVVQNQNGKTVKRRDLLGLNYYAGISGTEQILLTGLEPGKYTVALVCNDSSFVLEQKPIEITVTNQEEGSKQDYFPEDLFKNKDICGQYFANADKAGVTYTVEDGEYVMGIPHHMGFDYLYTWDAIPYDTFTVSFDFLLHIKEDADSLISDEADFLFGMSEETTTHHQLQIAHTVGDLSLNHWKRTADTPYTNYIEDNFYYDLYENETWLTISIQFTKDEVTIFLPEEDPYTLTETANFVGENGRIGFRGGSIGGWKIKNLKVTDGLYVGSEPTQTPDSVSTPTPTPTPILTAAPTEIATAQPTQNDAGNYMWIIVTVVVVVAVCAVGTFLLVLKKKK